MRACFPNSLHGYAFDFFENQNFQPDKNLAEIVDIMETHFPNAILEETVLCNAMNRLQRENESVHQYSLELMKIFQDYRAIEDESKTKLMVSMFIQGLEPEIQIMMNKTYPKYEDAVKDARICEARQEATRNRRRRREIGRAHV